MGKKRSSSLLLIPVLFLFACQPTYLDRVGVTHEDTRSMQIVELDKTRNIEGYSNYKDLSTLEAIGVNSLLGVTLENIRLNSLNLEYPIIKEMITSLNSTSDKSEQVTSISDTISSTHVIGDKGKRELTYSLIDGTFVYDVIYKRTFDNLEDFEQTKKTFDTFIIESMPDYTTRDITIDTTTSLNPISYQVYSKGVEHFTVNATNDSYGRYVLTIQYNISSNIDYYLKSVYPSALKKEGVLSVGTEGQYKKTDATKRVTEDFIPQLSETLGIALDNYTITNKGTVQESAYMDEDYMIRILSEEGYVIYGEVSFIGESLDYNNYKKVIKTILTTLRLKEFDKNTYNHLKEITQYSDSIDALVEERVFQEGGVNRLYFMNLAESENFIEYQLLRGLGTTYMNYR